MFFKKIGITEIDSICLISNLPKNMSVIELRNDEFLVKEKFLNYEAGQIKDLSKVESKLNLESIILKTT